MFKLLFIVIPLKTFLRYLLHIVLNIVQLYHSSILQLHILYNFTLQHF